MSEKPRSWNEIRNASFEFVRRFQNETGEPAKNRRCIAGWMNDQGANVVDLGSRRKSSRAG